jgi:8-hydroxy-5-deazaflavin:NADPH oxidoreductase
VKIGIIGSGNIGATAARLFAEAGHEVALSHSRGPESLKSLISSIGGNVRATTVDDAIAFGDVVLLALPWRNRQELPPADRFAGKIAIDATNPYTATGGLFDLGASSSSEEIAKQLAGVPLVKAFNTMYFKHLGSGVRKDLDVSERNAIFVAGDDPEAKTLVSRLITDIGFAPVDTGSLPQGGRRQQPGSDIYNKPMAAAQARALLSAT